MPDPLDGPDRPERLLVRDDAPSPIPIADTTTGTPREALSASGLWPLALALLVPLTSLAVASVSPWLVVPYLVLIGGILFTPGQRGKGDPRPEAGPADDGIPEDGRSASDLEPASEPNAPVDQASEPGSTSGVASPRTRRGKGRGRSKERSKPEPSARATWVRVGPGKFVRVEGPETAPIAVPSESGVDAAIVATEGSPPAPAGSEAGESSPDLAISAVESEGDGALPSPGVTLPGPVDFDVAEAIDRPEWPARMGPTTDDDAGRGVGTGPDGRNPILGGAEGVASFAEYFSAEEGWGDVDPSPRSDETRGPDGIDSEQEDLAEPTAGDETSILPGPRAEEDDPAEERAGAPECEDGGPRGEDREVGSDEAIDGCEASDADGSAEDRDISPLMAEATIVEDEREDRASGPAVDEGFGPETGDQDPCEVADSIGPRDGQADRRPGESAPDSGARSTEEDHLVALPGASWRGLPEAARRRGPRAGRRRSRCRRSGRCVRSPRARARRDTWRPRRVARSFSPRAPPESRPAGARREEEKSTQPPA